MDKAKKKNPLANGGWKNYINYIVIIAFLIIMIILNLTVGLGRGDKSTLARIAFSCILAVSLNLVVGFLGELSLGHAGFMCVGAYLGCYTANILRGSTGLPDLVVVIIAMIIAGIVAAIFGFVIGLPALRLRGDYLAIATLAFGEIVTRARCPWWRTFISTIPWPSPPWKTAYTKCASIPATSAAPKRCAGWRTAQKCIMCPSASGSIPAPWKRIFWRSTAD